MYFEEEDVFDLNSDFLNIVRREFYGLNSELSAGRRSSMASIPTHTEDGIPIRKLYVTNLPPNTTRGNLFNVFAQYGFIKNCWLPQGEPRGLNRIAGPTYAFVTYSNPKDAYKALTAPQHEKCIHGRHLLVSPADSWHQPMNDCDDRVRWKQQLQRDGDISPSANTTVDGEAGQMATSDPVESSSSTVIESESSNSSEPMETEQTSETDPVYTILDILNRDCFYNILSYIPICELIRSERVSKGWQSLIQEYLDSMRVFKTSWWQHRSKTLTTAVLRRVLERMGGSLTRLHIDHHMSALNDRTAHSVGKYCPNLEELKVVGMDTRNWNPLMYGCKQLKVVSFVSCNKLTDSSLVYIVKSDSDLESLTVKNNTHVTGLFLTGAKPRKLNSLSFYNCCSLQGTVLCAAIDKINNLTTLRLDMCPTTIWKMLPSILKKLPNLEELSISQCTMMCTPVEIHMPKKFMEQLYASFVNLTKLKVLNLSKNIYITNEMLKNIGQYCTELRSLDVSSCNPKRSIELGGVDDEGITAICRGCPQLTYLDISYLANLTDAGVKAAATCQQLTTLIAKGYSNLTTQPFVQCLASCHYLQEMDVCGCELVCDEMVDAAVKAVERRPRALLLRLAGTSAFTTVNEERSQRNRLVTLNFTDDRCDPHLRPDFDDHDIDDSSERYISLDELDDDIFDSDDDLFEDEYLYDDDMDGLMYGFELHAPNILLE